MWLACKPQNIHHYGRATSSLTISCDLTMIIHHLPFNLNRWSKQKRQSNSQSQFEAYISPLSLFDREFVIESFN